MAGWSDFHRLRKYRKRLERRWDDRVAMLKWRYVGKVEGPPDEPLWGKPEESPRRRGPRAG